MYHQYVPEGVHRFLVTAAFVVAAVALSIGLQTFAWSPPASAPPNSDADAPLTVGSGAQTKTGTLRIDGNVGLGAAPSATADIDLLVAGRVRIQGGNPGTGKVLTSSGPGGDAAWVDINAKCSGITNCTSFADGTVIQWGKLTGTSANRTTSGSKYRRLVSMPVSYSSLDYVVNVTPSGTVAQITSANCTPGIDTSGYSSGLFYIMTDGQCDGVVFGWTATGK